MGPLDPKGAELLERPAKNWVATSPASRSQSQRRLRLKR